MCAESTDLARLAIAVERLTNDLERRERQHHRTRFALATALLLGSGIFLGNQIINPAGAQAQPQAASQDARSAAREALLKQLLPEQRRDIERFEQEVAWVSHYLQLYGDQFNPGAVIAVMLGRMAKSVEVVPEMRTEMQIMNAKMNALPVMATEMQGMNAKMGVMAAGMDSTMGRTGRMMPWSW
jgi:hypothetical protein